MSSLEEVLREHQWHYGHDHCICGHEVPGEHLSDIAAHQAEAVAAAGLTVMPEAVLRQQLTAAWQAGYTEALRRFPL